MERLTTDEERFQLAAQTARRIVRQCRAHVRTSTSKLSDRVNTAASSTPAAIDIGAAAQGRHPLALKQRIQHVESTSNSLLSHLSGLSVLLESDTFLALPAISIARSIAEVAASCAWMLDARIDADERAARGYASLFRSLDSTEHLTDPTQERFGERRDKLIAELQKTGVRVDRRKDRHGVEQNQVAAITVGRAHAKPGFRYSQRVAEEIPMIANTYAGMSALVHGEQSAVAMSWDSPDTVARLVGTVVLRSVEAWSRAVHIWVGVSQGPFVNALDVRNIIRSMPPSLLDEFGPKADRDRE